jgi:integrase
MPRAKQPARLWLRPAAGGRQAVWLILDNGKQHSTGFGPEGRGGAEEALAEYIGAKRDPTRIECRRADQTDVSDVLAVYLREVVPGQRDPAKAAARITNLLRWWGTRKLSEVTPETCRAYAAHRIAAPLEQATRSRKDGAITRRLVEPKKPRSGGGARRDLEDLRAAIEHHAERELHSGVVRVTLPPKGKARTKYLTPDEVARLLWVCWRHKRTQVPPRGPRKGQKVESKDFYDLRHLARFILMGVYTGTRSGSILKASVVRSPERAWVDLDHDMFFRLPEDQVEADNKRYPAVRMPRNLAAHIRRWHQRGIIDEYVVEWGRKPGERKSVSSIKTAWARAVALAGIEGNPTPHTLRHTAVSWLKQQGVPSFDVGRFAGMSERMVEEVYGHHDPDFQRETADTLSYGRRRMKAGRILRN